jgi:hypothetical protein
MDHVGKFVTYSEAPACVHLERQCQHITLAEVQINPHGLRAIFESYMISGILGR